MESNEEKFRQFKEKIDQEMEERRAYNKLIEKSITLSICGGFLGIIPYVGWIILIFSFCYCCYVLKKTWSGVAFFSVIVCVVALVLRYIFATTL